MEKRIWALEVKKTNLELINSQPNSFNGYGMVLDGTLFSTTTPFLEFSIKFQSNNLIYDKGYSKRQQVIYSLILFLREEGMGYRRISRKLNQWEIKTHRGKKWFNSFVISVLKKAEICVIEIGLAILAI